MRRHHRLIAWGLVLAKGTLLLVFAAHAEPLHLPEGSGRELTERTCSQCHSLELVLKHRMTRRQWEAQLDAMIAKGAKLDDENFDALAAYLAAALGPAPSD